MFVLYERACVNAGSVCVVLGLIASLALAIGNEDPAESHTLRTASSQFVLQTIISLRGRSVLRRLRRSASRLAESQDAVLSSILKRNSQTTYGRRNRFAELLAADAIRRAYVVRVPLTTHDDYLADIERLVESKDALAAGILTAERVEFLCYSSGTTGKNKLVPVTRWPKVSSI